MKPKRSGWQMMNTRMHRKDPPPETTRWEKELIRRGLTEAGAIENPRPLREWVKKNRLTHYVPTVVLERLGMREF